MFTGQQSKATDSSPGTTFKERFYLSGFELYREYGDKRALTLARETLHVMDHEKRAALLETTGVDSSVPPASLASTTTRYQVDNHLGTASLELAEGSYVISYGEYYPYGSTSYQAKRTVAAVGLKREDLRAAGYITGSRRGRSCV